MLDMTVTVPEATVAEIENLSDPALGIVVEAWVMPLETTELCSEDELHGPGLVQVPMTTTDIAIIADDKVLVGRTETVTHAMCLKCALAAAEQKILDGETWISVDVTR